MNTPKLAIFDMDGLIFDSERLFMGFLQKAAADLGYEITPEKYALTLGVGGDTLAARVREIDGADYPHREVSRRARLAMNDWTEHHTIPVKEGIPELLEFFTARQIPCCVASSTPTDHVNRYLEQAGLARYFSRITGGDQVSHSKPTRRSFCCPAAISTLPRRTPWCWRIPRTACWLPTTGKSRPSAFRI